MPHAVETAQAPHPQAVHVLIPTPLAVTGWQMVSVTALSTHQTKRDNTVADHATSVEKIPEDDRPNDHPHSLA